MLPFLPNGGALWQLSMPLTPWCCVMFWPCAPYGTVCWDPWKLELVHNVELRAKNALDQLCWLLISSWAEFKVLVWTYKAPNGYPGGCFPSYSPWNWDQPETLDLGFGIHIPNPSTWAGLCQKPVCAGSSAPCLMSWLGMVWGLLSARGAVWFYLLVSGVAFPFSLR